jgi:hypothetical protein
MQSAQDSDTLSTASMTKGGHTSFDLLGLPAEIRNRIYSFVFAEEAEPGALSNKRCCHHYLESGDQHPLQVPPRNPSVLSRDIASFSIPHITQASRQLRRETIPIFFQESAFVAYVCSNLRDRRNARRGLPLQQRRDLKGVLYIHADLRTTICSFDRAALIRDITFNVGIKASEDVMCWSSSRTAVHIRVQFLGTKGGVKVTSQDGGMTMRSYDREDVEFAVERVRKAAEDMGTKARFKGFTIWAVELLAKELRFKCKY